MKNHPTYLTDPTDRTDLPAPRFAPAVPVPPGQLPARPRPRTAALLCLGILGLGPIAALLGLIGACLMSMIVPTPTQKGIGVYWGTQGTNGGGTNLFFGAILEDLDITPHNAGPVARIENGDGVTVTKVYVPDGFEASANMLWSSNLILPKVGDPFTLQLSGNAFDYGTGQLSNVVVCTVDSYGLKLARKKEAIIPIRFSSDPGTGY